MSPNARLLVLGLGALMLFGGTLLTVLTGGGGGEQLHVVLL